MFDARYCLFVLNMILLIALLPISYLLKITYWINGLRKKTLRLMTGGLPVNLEIEIQDR